MDSLSEDVLKAVDRIKPHIRKTPLEYSPWLSGLGKSNVYVKLESEQITGSFKVRGAFNKLLYLKETGDEVFLERGAVTASTGNHAMASALVSSKIGVKVTIYVPETISPAKLNATKMYGGSVKFQGQDCLDAEMKARSVSEEENLPFVSPYNDLVIVAGQGTIGVEVFEDLPSVDVVFVAVGGGGLIGGIGAYLKSVKPSLKMIGCQPAQDAAMSASVKAGNIVEFSAGNTLSDGTAGGVENNAVTFELCRSLVDEWILVTEEEISKAVYQFLENHHKVVEGAAGVALAAYLKVQERFQGQNVVIISCGANLSMNKLKDIILQWS